MVIFSLYFEPQYPVLVVSHLDFITGDMSNSCNYKR